MHYEPIRMWVSESSPHRLTLADIRRVVHEELLAQRFPRVTNHRPTQRDVARAVKAMISAGMAITRVEISAQGSIVVDTTPIRDMKASVETDFFEKRARARR